MSIRRRAIRARVERDRTAKAKRAEALYIVDDVTTKLRADTYENLFLRSGQLGHYSGTVIRP
jgi:hypothetical protein